MTKDKIEQGAHEEALFDNTSLINKFFALSDIPTVTSIPALELDTSLTRDIHLETGKAARYVIMDVPVNKSGYSRPLQLTGNSREAHFLRLNMLVHLEGDEVHTWPDQSQLFSGFVDVNGDVYQILSSQVSQGLKWVRRMIKLEPEEAKKLLKKAVKLKEYLANKDQEK